MEQKKNVLGRRIAQLCMKRHMSYYTLASDSEIPLTTLLHITNGTTKNPGIFTVMKICSALSVTLSEFTAGLEEEL